MIPGLHPYFQGDGFNVVANIEPPRENCLLNIVHELIDRAARKNGVRFVLFDCAASAEDPLSSAAFAESNYGFILTSPDPTFRDTVVNIQKEHQRRYPQLTEYSKIGVVVNQVMTAKHYAIAKTYKPFGIIPFNPLMMNNTIDGEQNLIEDMDQDMDSDPLDVMTMDYDLGYSDVEGAIQSTLKEAFIADHRGMLPNEIRTGFVWWKQVPALARSKLATKTERFLTWTSFLAPFVLLVAIVALYFLARPVCEVPESNLTSTTNRKFVTYI